jgi:predicted amidohydrolase
VFGTSYKLTDSGTYHNRGVVYDPNGSRVVFYWKNRDVPQQFRVCGVPCNLAICSDRGYLEHSDLPCLVQGSQVIVDISGGHGGDDGRPDLKWIRYRPWARRTNAYVIVSNPVHDDVDFMGHRPWGGGSAIVRPDGSIQASRTYEKDVVIVAEIDPAKATRAEAKRRRSHPLFKGFWDMGERLLAGRAAAPVTPAAKIKPYSSARRSIKIGAAQMACSRDRKANTDRIVGTVARAAKARADVVVFPELAVTGHRSDDVTAASRAALADALKRIRDAARAGGIHVIVGMPQFVGGARRNCAVVIGDDGNVKTRYAQIVSRRPGLFEAGESAKAMWFTLKGVQAIVTVGDDADWVEIADLAANRGMCMHFHISYRADGSAGAAVLRRQRDLLMLRYATYGAVVNAADPSGMPDPSAPAAGGSLIVSREGGHNQAAPADVEHYLPYQTSIIKGARTGEAMLCATREAPPTNSMDLDRHWRNRNRRRRKQTGWHDWMASGARLIGGDPRE